jgi:hypothetical protein
MFRAPFPAPATLPAEDFRTVTCADCRTPFVYDATWYAAHQWHAPRRCGPCRAERRAQRASQALPRDDGRR